MPANGETRRVHFDPPAELVERVDAIASLLHKDRSELLNEALRAYVQKTADRDSFQQLVANEYYESRLEFETVKRLVGADTAQRFRLLKADLDDEPLDLFAPEDTDIYDGDLRTVESQNTDQSE